MRSLLVAGQAKPFSAPDLSGKTVSLRPGDPIAVRRFPGSASSIKRKVPLLTPEGTDGWRGGGVPYATDVRAALRR